MNSLIFRFVLLLSCLQNHQYLVILRQYQVLGIKPFGAGLANTEICKVAIIKYLGLD